MLFRSAKLKQAGAQMSKAFGNDRSPEKMAQLDREIANRGRGLDRAQVRSDKARAEYEAKRQAEHEAEIRAKYADVDIDAEIARLQPAIKSAYNDYQYGARNTYSQARSEYHRLMAQVQQLHQAKELLAQDNTNEGQLSELSNELLGRYKKELGIRASAADRAGDYDQGHEYFKKITKATLRQGENDARKHAQREKENEMMETRLNMMRKAGYDL